MTYKIINLDGSRRIIKTEMKEVENENFSIRELLNKKAILKKELEKTDLIITNVIKDTKYTKQELETEYTKILNEKLYI